MMGILATEEDLYELRAVLGTKTFRLSIVFASSVYCATTVRRQEWMLQEQVSVSGLLE